MNKIPNPHITEYAKSIINHWHNDTAHYPHLDADAYNVSVEYLKLVAENVFLRQRIEKLEDKIEDMNFNEKEQHLKNTHLNDTY